MKTGRPADMKTGGTSPRAGTSNTSGPPSEWFALPIGLKTFHTSTPASANTANAVTAAVTRDGRLGGTGAKRGPSKTRVHRSDGSSALRSFASSVCQRSAIDVLLIAEQLAEPPPPAEH